MFHFYVLSFFKKGDNIQGGTLFKGGHYLRKYGNSSIEIKNCTYIHITIYFHQKKTLCGTFKRKQEIFHKKNHRFGIHEKTCHEQVKYRSKYRNTTY